jgi:hypothetical protein
MMRIDREATIVQRAHFWAVESLRSRAATACRRPASESGMRPLEGSTIHDERNWPLTLPICMPGSIQKAL